MKPHNQLSTFETLYAENNLKQWGLPAFVDIEPKEGIFRKPYVKWSELPKGIEAGGSTDLYYVCADVLEIDTEVLISTGTFLFARRIIVSGGGKLAINGTDDLASLLLVTNQVTDSAGENISLPLGLIDAAGTETPTHISAAFENRELYVSEVAAGEKTVNSYPASQLDPAYLLQGQPLLMFLRSEFQLATLLLNNHPWESIHQLDYVGAVASANPKTRLLAGQARALANTLRSTQAVSANGLLVPRLDYSIYADSAAKALNVLSVRQESYDRMIASVDNLEQWKKNAELTFAVNDKQEDLTRELLLKAHKTSRQMEQARAIAARQVAATQVSLIYKRAEFENGVEIWKEELILKNIFKIIIGIVKILAEIPTLVATGPAAVGGMVNSAGSALSSLASIGAGLAESAVNSIRIPMTGLSFEDVDLQDMQEIIDGNQPAEAPAPAEDPSVEEIMDDFEQMDADAIKKGAKARAAAAAAEEKNKNAFTASVKNVVGAGKEIADAALNIAATVKKAAQMEAASQQAILAINEGVGKSFSDIVPRGLDVVTGGSQEWDRLSILIKAFFDRVPDEVPGKAAFQQEYERFIISAQAMCQARLALAKANSEVAEAVLRLKTAKETATLYQNRVASLGDKVAQDKVLAQLAYDKILDAKRSVYLYHESYRRAFLYYTLKPLKNGPKLPDLSASFDTINAAVNKITNARMANESLVNPAREMNNLELVLRGEALTREFRERGVLQFVLKPDDPLFRTYCRIRLNEIEVFADGLTQPEKVNVQLTNNGVYMDKDFSKRTRYFVAAKYKSSIQYKTKDQSLIFSGKIDARDRDDYFSPTPFSTWTIVVRSSTGALIDLSGVEAVRVVFSGKYSILN